MRAVHFGAGALGLGMVVPLLKEANFSVTVVDIDINKVRSLNENNQYTVKYTDENNREENIKLETSLTFEDKKQIYDEIHKASVITTSVRSENLESIAILFKELCVDLSGKIILCAENIINSGNYFRKILNNYIDHSLIDNIIIPNTMVDRICSSDWPKSTIVLTEKFYEFCVDVDISNTIEQSVINFSGNINQDFNRKRLLLNTFADASCFVGKSMGLNYLYECASNMDIYDMMKDYFAEIIDLIHVKYEISYVELHDWQAFYKERLSNRMIDRTVSSVARDFWRKMSPTERFLSPIVEMKGEEIMHSGSLRFIAKLIKTQEGDKKTMLELLERQIMKEGEKYRWLYEEIIEEGGLDYED